MRTLREVGVLGGLDSDTIRHPISIFSMPEHNGVDAAWFPKIDLNPLLSRMQRHHACFVLFLVTVSDRATAVGLQFVSLVVTRLRKAKFVVPSGPEKGDAAVVEKARCEDRSRLCEAAMERWRRKHQVNRREVGPAASRSGPTQKVSCVEKP